MRRLSASAIAVGVLLASGCGASTQTVTVNSPPATTGSSQTTATTSSTATTSAAPPKPTQTLRLSSFQSPSGNIGCMLIGDLARCDIVRRQWSPPPRPSSCPQIVDYGQGLEVGHSGAGRFVCAGDTARDPAAPKLAYGTATRHGHFLCQSATSGVTCTDETSGHGFFVSIQSYRIF